MFEIENVREMDKLSWEVRKLGHFTGIEQNVSDYAHLEQYMVFSPTAVGNIRVRNQEIIVMLTVFHF